MRACTWGCKRSCPPTARRSCKAPNFCAPAGWEQDLRYKATDRGRSIPCAAPGFATQVAAPSGAPEEAAAIDDHLSAREHSSRIAFDAKALEHRIIHAHVMSRCADDMLGFRIPDHEVRVARRRYFALARIQAEQPGGRGGDEFHKPVQRDAILVNAMVINELQTIFDARSAVRNFREVVDAER